MGVAAQGAEMEEASRVVVKRAVGAMGVEARVAEARVVARAKAIVVEMSVLVAMVVARAKARMVMANVAEAMVEARAEATAAAARVADHISRIESVLPPIDTMCSMS